MRIIMDKRKPFQDPNNGYIVMTRQKKVLQDPTLPTNRVTISMKKVSAGIVGDPNVPNSGKYMFEVSVHSTHKEGLMSRIQVDPGQASGAQQLIRNIQVAAGAAAEHLCEMYGDRLDPDHCAKVAAEIFGEVMRKFKEMQDSGQDLQVEG